MNDNELRALVEAQKDWIVNIRRKLHRIPERGFDLLSYPDANSRGVVENIIYAGMPSVAERVLTPCGNRKEKKNDGSL